MRERLRLGLHFFLALFLHQPPKYRRRYFRLLLADGFPAAACATAISRLHFKYFACRPLRGSNAAGFSSPAVRFRLPAPVSSTSRRPLRHTAVRRGHSRNYVMRRARYLGRYSLMLFRSVLVALRADFAIIDEIDQRPGLHQRDACFFITKLSRYRMSLHHAACKMLYGLPISQLRWLSRYFSVTSYLLFIALIQKECLK